MDNIKTKARFTYDEQTEWNRLKELNAYVQNIRDIDAKYLEAVNVLIGGFVSMLNETTKTTVLECIRDLLESTKKRHVQYDADSSM